MRRTFALGSLALVTCVGVGLWLHRRQPELPHVEANDEPIGELEIDDTENASELHSLPLELSEPSDAGAAIESATFDPTDGGTQAQSEAAGSLPTDAFLAQPMALDRFYTRVAASLRGEGGVIRVAHYGDSLITSDYLSGTARRLLQRDLGDGGHGFLAIANPWEWYFHNDVAHAASRGWRQSRITGPLARDHAYGPAGVVFRGNPGASAVFGTAKDGPFGRNVSRFVLLYAARPGGGEVELKSGESTHIVDTEAAEETPRHAVLEVEDGAAKMSVRVLRGEVKLYGVALERERGVIYDALGVLGARAKMWHATDLEHLRACYTERAPALIVVQFGTNEIEAGPVDADYPKMLRDLLLRWQGAAPEASLLLMAAPDRAERTASGELRSNRTLQKLVAMQAEIAKDLGVAFFDTPAAMGGDGAMVRWVHQKLGSTDLVHPLPAGGERLGQLFVDALRAGYARWREAHHDAPAWRAREPHSEAASTSTN